MICNDHRQFQSVIGWRLDLLLDFGGSARATRIMVMSYSATGGPT